MIKPQPPDDLDRSQKKRFRSVIQNLIDVDLDPAQRATLVAEHVRVERRLAELRAAEKSAGTSMPIVRAVNVAAAEMRRLHSEIFKGARKKELAKSVPDEIEADQLWRRRLWHAAGPSVEELQRQYGSPSWSVLIYQNHAEWLADDARLTRLAGDNRLASPRTTHEAWEHQGGIASYGSR